MGRPRKWREAQRRRDFIALTVATLIALAGGVAYLLWPTDLMWWLGPLAAGPLLWLVYSFQKQTKAHPKDTEHFQDRGADDAWWPPS
jgi:apolipoprotein N-acyltransferase